MAYTILSESYGRRLPKITAEADSTDDLAILGIDYAEGSTCNVGGTEYTLDKVSGWIIPGSGGGGGSDLPTVTSADNGKVLGVVSGEWDKMDKGWNVEQTQLFSETVTTEQDEYAPYGVLTYDQFISADVLTVVFDGVEYTCNRVDYSPDDALKNGYGAQLSEEGPDFSEYPFAISSYSQNGGPLSNVLYTETAGAHTVSVVAPTPTVSPEFESVLDSFTPKMTFEIIPGTTTYTEAHNAFLQGKVVFIHVLGGDSEKAIALYFGPDSTQPEYNRVVGVRVDANCNITYLVLNSDSEEDDILR